jgi:hypothetical protein
MLIQLKDSEGENAGLLQTNTDSWETIVNTIREAEEYAQEQTEQDETSFHFGDFEKSSAFFYEFLKKRGMNRVFIDNSIEVTVL